MCGSNALLKQRKDKKILTIHIFCYYSFTVWLNEEKQTNKIHILIRFKDDWLLENM